MAFTVLLSGPVASRDEARRALRRAGFTAQEDPPHQLEKDRGLAFVAVETDDVDGPAAALANLGWSHRSTAAPSMVTHPLLEDIAPPTVDEDLLRRIVREELEKN